MRSRKGEQDEYRRNDKIYFIWRSRRNYRVATH